MHNLDQLSTLTDKYFPYDNYNPGQKEAILFATSNILDGKKHILMELPTGIGKSTIAITVHKVLNALDESHRTTILTSTKGLQDQYQREDLQLFSLMGKNNYPCPKNDKSTYCDFNCRKLVASGYCRPYDKNSNESCCTYLGVRNKWLNVKKLRITNTTFFIKAPVKMLSDPEKNTRAKLTVIDECHVIDDHLVNNAALQIFMDELKIMERHLGITFVGKFADYINSFSDVELGTAFFSTPEIKEISDAFIADLHSKIGELEEKIEDKETKLSDIANYQILVTDLSAWVENILNFAHSKGEWILEEYSYAKKLKLIPVYASQVVQRAMYDKSDVFIHMSATICGFDEYMKVMGINKADAVTMQTDNPIPLEQRPVYPLSLVRVSGKYDARDVAKSVDTIIDHQNTTDNGVIHTVSFQLANDIKNNSKHKRRMVVSNNREEILELLKKPNGKILLSPSVEVGYDFKDDQARWQILAKVPYEYLGSFYIKLNADRSKKWYARKAIIRLVQSSGRCVRGMKDFAVTYIIDSNFDRLIEQHPDLFPTWYKNAIIV